MGAYQDADLPNSEAIDVNAEEGAHLLGKTVERSQSESNVIFTPAAFGYDKAGKRPNRDGAFSIALVAFTTASISVGIFATFNYNPDFFTAGYATYDNSAKGCTVPKWGYDAPIFSISYISKTALLVPLAALIPLVILSASLTSGLLWLLRKHTKKMFIAVPFMLTILLTTIVAGPVPCPIRYGCNLSDANPTIYAILIIFAYFFLSLLWTKWESIELSIRVIRTASEVLHKNLALLLVLPALRTAFLLYYLPISIAMILAYANGKIVLSSKVAPYQHFNLEVVCMMSDEPCCVWETDRWVFAYLTLAIFAIFWGSMVLNEVEVFIISGTISQWYFGAAQKSTTVKGSLRHPLGPSFGTVCFAGLVLAPTRSFEGAAASTSKKGGIARFLHDCVRSVLPCFKFMTNFTTDFAAITGEDFCSSARMACDLLKRNSLSAVVANSVPRRLLGTFAIVSSAFCGVLLWGVQDLFVWNLPQRFLTAFGIFGLLSIAILNPIRILAQVVDSLYICYAIDKDNGEVSKTMVHDVYALLPPSPDSSFSAVTKCEVTP